MSATAAILDIHPALAEPDLYPSEGPKVVQSLSHSNAVIHLANILQGHCHAQWAQAIVAADVYLHAYPGGRRVSPDIQVHLQPLRPHHDTLPFVVEHDGAPDLVVEVLSEATWEDDIWGKKEKDGTRQESKDRYYARLGVREYWISDPDNFMREEQYLYGFALDQDGVYRPLSAHRQVIEGVPVQVWESAVLGTVWGLDERCDMRLYNPYEGKWYPTYEEIMAEHEKMMAAHEEMMAEREGFLKRIAELEHQLRTREVDDSENRGHTPPGIL